MKYLKLFEATQIDWKQELMNAADWTDDRWKSLVIDLEDFGFRLINCEKQFTNGSSTLSTKKGALEGRYYQGYLLNFKSEDSKKDWSKPENFSELTSIVAEAGLRLQEIYETRILFGAHWSGTVDNVKFILLDRKKPLDKRLIQLNSKSVNQGYMSWTVNIGRLAEKLKKNKIFKITPGIESIKIEKTELANRMDADTWYNLLLKILLLTPDQKNIITKQFKREVEIPFNFKIERIEPETVIIYEPKKGRPKVHINPTTRIR